jgi:hypothetical protein
MKQCPRCEKILPNEYFNATSSYCKFCRRDYEWQYKYGLSPEQYYEMWKAQEGKCKICGKKPKDGSYLCVDHNAQTGEIRGLLCNQCNKGLGDFKDNPDSLRKAVEYLEENDG